ncbi:MAG: ExbD/TolR family protein [Chlamydiota bacterium]
MTFIPEEELQSKSGLNLTPMIDFLFLMLAFFACLAVSRTTVRDTNVDLVEIASEPTPTITQESEDLRVIRINITGENQYQWVTDVRDYPLENPEEITTELLRQYERGLLPVDKSNTKVLVKIDKNASWEPILKGFFAVREAGFEVRPIYQPEEVAETSLGRSKDKKI